MVVACHSEKDPKTELEELKKEEAALKAKIAVLEAEVCEKNDSSAGCGIAVSVLELRPETFKNYITIQGKVDADENVSLSSGMPGIVTKINVSEGDVVHIGQVLAETDAQLLNQSIADLQINSDLVNQLYERQKLLWENKVGTEVQYLQAKTNKESMEKKMAVLLQQLNNSKIISPINGTVDAIDIKLGQLAAPGVPAIRVINFSNLKVKAEISESYASKIKKGTNVFITFPDRKDSLITKVNFVSRTINPSTRSFTCEVLLDNKEEYFPNMIANLNINDYESANSEIVISVKAVQKDDSNQSFVYLAEKNLAQKRVVMLGKEFNGRVEIKSGLKEGDLLITEGYDTVNEGEAIAYKN
jgi:membrane fusion protein, multidrug efflux system